MFGPVSYMVAGAAIYAVLSKLYDRFYNPRIGRERDLAAENRYLSEANSALRNRLSQSSTEVHAAVDDSRLVDLVRSGNKIAAIRDYRAATGAGLEAAKIYIESLDIK